MFVPAESIFHADTLARVSGAVSDTLHAAATKAAEGGGTFNFGELLEHMKDTHWIDTPFGRLVLPQFPPIVIGGMSIDLSITKHVFFLWVAGVLLCIAGISAARRYRKTLVPSGFSNALELAIIFVRDDIVLSNMGKGGLPYLSYLLTTFFFILFMNLLGLIPFGITSTSNVSVTGGLAVIAFVMIQVAAIRAQGFSKYLAHLTGGVPWYLWFITIPVEIIGLFTKPFALCLRLFANMTGGHMVALSLIGIIFIFQSYILAPVPLVFAAGISLLEIIVAFLQAYIFTILTGLFMGVGILAAEHHGDEH
jgi:F-type H+-transporting ATPase subunit a